MKTTINYEVKESTWPQRAYLTKRAKVSFDKLTDFFSSSYGAIYRQLEQMKINSNDAPFAIYYEVDEANMTTDLAAAVLLPEPVTDIEGFELVKMPASKVISVDYYGPYDYMAPAYERLEKYAKEHNYTKAAVMEQYFTDPLIEKDPENWKTVINFVLK